jgi:hypothetical protein
LWKFKFLDKSRKKHEAVTEKAGFVEITNQQSRLFICKRLFSYRGAMRAAPSGEMVLRCVV